MLEHLLHSSSSTGSREPEQIARRFSASIDCEIQKKEGKKGKRESKQPEITQEGRKIPPLPAPVAGWWCHRPVPGGARLAPWETTPRARPRPGKQTKQKEGRGKKKGKKKASKAVSFLNQLAAGSSAWQQGQDAATGQPKGVYGAVPAPKEASGDSRRSPRFWESHKAPQRFSVWDKNHHRSQWAPKTCPERRRGATQAGEKPGGKGVGRAGIASGAERRKGAAPPRFWP